MVIRDTNRFLSRFCTVSDASFPIGRTNPVFFWSNKTASRISFFDFWAPLKNWRCGASIPVPLACKAIALPSELHPQWGDGELMTSGAFLLSMQWLNRVFYCIWLQNWLCRCGSSIYVFLTCQSLALSFDMPRWWGPHELFMSDGCLWLSFQ